MSEATIQTKRQEWRGGEGGVNDEEEEEVMGSLALRHRVEYLCTCLFLRGVLKGGIDSREMGMRTDACRLWLM